MFVRFNLGLKDLVEDGSEEDMTLRELIMKYDMSLRHEDCWQLLLTAGNCCSTAGSCSQSVI